ncbi:unnamed protein product [Linum tenue]|uniref:F-box domain-containing protein n=1 Tax=Linum tenue TaxID=586396 RepID=A0AAV0J199_9ROSI|nr:unnamed protein product [Linum tenue]
MLSYSGDRLCFLFPKLHLLLVYSQLAMATQVYYRKRKPITSTSSLFSKLDVDLLLEVLIRLPDPRSAVRCKPVCKLWNSLLPAPYFSPRFLSHHPISFAGEPKPPPLTPSELRELILSFLPLPSHIDPSSPSSIRPRTCSYSVSLRGKSATNCTQRT